MYRSFNENNFDQAVFEKDYLSIRIYALCALRYDPAFDKGESDRVLKRLNEIEGVYEKFNREDYEEWRKEKEKWDEDYFFSLICWMEDNFAKERLEHIKEVGKAVYAEEKANKVQVGISSLPPKAPAGKVNWKIIAMIIFAVLAIAIPVVLKIIVGENQ